MGEKGQVSRRDFFKLLKAAGGGLVADRLGLFKLLESGGLDIATESMRAIVRKVEKPPDWLKVPLPENNEHYLPADKIMKNAKDIYQDWYARGMVKNRLHSTKSPVYVGIEDLSLDVAETALRIYDDYLYILTSDVSDEEKKYHIENMRDRLLVDFTQQMRDELDAKEVPNCSPFKFANHDIYDFETLVKSDPGCGIIERAAKRDGGLSLESFDDEVQEVWKWVDETVEKNGAPMGMDLFVAGLCVFNQGDIRKAYLDATILTKLVRTHPKTYNRYVDSLDPNGSERASLEQGLEKMSHRLRDQFALVTSNNWVMDNVGFDPRVFGMPGDDHGLEWKFLDANVPVGHYYHGLNLSVMPTAIDYRLIPALFIGEYQDFYKEHGVEKLFADLDVIMRAVAIEREFNNVLVN